MLLSVLLGIGGITASVRGSIRIQIVVSHNAGGGRRTTLGGGLRGVSNIGGVRFSDGGGRLSGIINICNGRFGLFGNSSGPLSSICIMGTAAPGGAVAITRGTGGLERMSSTGCNKTSTGGLFDIITDVRH